MVYCRGSCQEYLAVLALYYFVSDSRCGNCNGFYCISIFVVMVRNGTDDAAAAPEWWWIKDFGRFAAALLWGLAEKVSHALSLFSSCRSHMHTPHVKDVNRTAWNCLNIVMWIASPILQEDVSRVLKGWTLICPKNNFKLLGTNVLSYSMYTVCTYLPVSPPRSSANERNCILITYTYTLYKTHWNFCYRSLREISASRIGIQLNLSQLKIPLADYEIII